MLGVSVDNILTNMWCVARNMDIFIYCNPHHCNHSRNIHDKYWGGGVGAIDYNDKGFCDVNVYPRKFYVTRRQTYLPFGGHYLRSSEI